MSNLIELADKGSVTTSSDIIRRDAQNGFSTPTAIGPRNTALSRIERNVMEIAARQIGIRVDEEQLDMSSQESHLSFEPAGISEEYRYREAAGAPSLADAMDKVKEEMLLPFTALKEQLQEGKSEAVTDASFNFEDDGDIALNFIGYGSKIRSSKATASIRFMGAITTDRGLPIRYPADVIDDQESQEGVYLNESGQIDKILTRVSQGMYRGLYFNHDNPDPVQDSFKMGVELSRAEVDQERDNGGLDVQTEAFAHTETAKDIADAISGAGLVLSEATTKSMAEDNSGHESKFSARYGNGYAELSREVAKFVNNPDRGIGSIFSGEDQDVRAKLQGIDISQVNSDGAKLFIGLLQQTLSRGEDRGSDIPVFEGALSMRSGSCKDSENKFVDVLVRGEGSYGNLSHSVIGEVTMLNKDNHGAETSINLQPLRYKGVVLPAGSLFQRHVNQDGEVEYAFVRITSFALRAEEARSAFTWQYVASEMHGYRADEQSLRILAKSYTV